MHIVSNESRGTISLHIADPWDAQLIKNIRRSTEYGRVVEYKGSNEIITASEEKRLQLLFHLPRRAYNALQGTTETDDYFVRAIERSIMAAATGLVPISLILSPKFSGMEVAIALCTICSHLLTDLVECRSHLCSSCHETIQRQVREDKEAKKALRASEVDLDWYREYRENRKSRGSGKKPRF